MRTVGRIALGLVLLLPMSCARHPTAVAHKTHDARAEFLALIDRPRVPPEARAADAPADAGLAVLRFSFLSERGQRVPGILLKPLDVSTAKRPVVVALHGTGGKKEDQLPLLRQLARKGLVAVAIDGRYHGERATRVGTVPGLNAYQSAIFHAWEMVPRADRSDYVRQHPFYYDSVYDVSRLLDYLATRDDVDPMRIGLIGTSKGGIEAYLAAAVDRRVSVVVPMIAVQSFQWALETNNWKGRIATILPAFEAIAKEAGVATPDATFVRAFYDRVVPRIYADFDCPQMLPLIAPRPMLIINGDSDPNCPLPGAKLAIASAEKAYADQNAAANLEVIIEPDTAHKVLPASTTAAVDFLTKHLHPQP